ncbi:MAG TPA: type II toxin-antitoxin system RelE/ParE family toxin [Chloroflexota bacterium]|nr:type II toxin-antitoxin system RelE/ParE family toxin [Chloroflexota bacterium]HET9449962.1 type II toxin-antitoxin system RelE/ParE family toxin [Aggregicoccus sp.]
MHRIVWSPMARHRLLEIIDFVARDSPDAAAQLHTTILRRVRHLNRWPESAPLAGALYPQLVSLGTSYRALVVRPYVVFYRVLPKEIRVLTVRHGAQLPPSSAQLAEAQPRTE